MIMQSNSIENGKLRICENKGEVMLMTSTLTQYVVDDLRRDILNQRYPNNKLITEAEVAKLYSVSKTPAREALGYLCQEGLIEKIPRKGYLIRKFSLMELKCLFQYRKILEEGVVELCARNATKKDIDLLYQLCTEADMLSEEVLYTEYNKVNDEFHIALAKITNNPYLIAAITSTLQLLRRTTVLDIKYTNPKERLASHKHLVDMIHRKDAKKAKEFIRKQLSAAEVRVYANDIIME